MGEHTESNLESQKQEIDYEALRQEIAALKKAELDKPAGEYHNPHFDEIDPALLIVDDLKYTESTRIKL